MTRPRPTEESLPDYYEGTYSRVRKNYRFQTDSVLGRMIPKYRLRTLMQTVPLSEEHRLLDVGCGMGDFLSLAHQTTGCAGTGLDLDQTSIERALDPEHLRYELGTIESIQPETSKFTVITFFQSLEHHRDPVAALRHAHALLAPGGACLVVGGFWRYVFRRYWMPLVVPQHLVHFDRRTLKSALAAAGFQRVVSHRSMFYPFEGLSSLALLLWRGLGQSRRVKWLTRTGLIRSFDLLPFASGFVPNQPETRSSNPCCGRRRRVSARKRRASALSASMRSAFLNAPIASSYMSESRNMRPRKT